MGMTQKLVWASAYNGWALQSQAADTYTWSSPQTCQFLNPYSGAPFGFKTTQPVLINDLVTPANSEVTTPTATSSIGFTPATLGHTHSVFTVLSGTAGLQEAINLSQGGTATHPQMVLLDDEWFAAAALIPGTSAAAIIAAATGSTSVVLVDTTTAPWTFYKWGGSSYAAASNVAGVTLANGQGVVYGSSTVNLTLLTTGLTTDTAAGFLPANSIIDSVVVRVTTTVATSTGWEVGDDSPSLTRFLGNQTGAQLTAGATAVGIPASTAATQTAAAKVRVTAAGGNPSAGVLRITAFWHTFTAPTS